MKELEGVSIVGVKHTDRIVEVVEETLQGNTVRILGGKRARPGPGLHLPKVRRNKFIEIL